MNYLQKLLRRFKEKDSSGFTIIEAAITIPMLALVGSVLFYLMAQSVMIMHNNSTAQAAAGASQKLVNEYKDSKSCYQIENINSESYDSIGKSTKDFKIETNIIPEKSGGCNISGYVDVTVTATEMSSDKVLFKTATRVTLAGY